MTVPRPPRLSRALLRLLAPPEDRPFLLDDLQEEFAERSARSPSAARRWYRIQAITSLGPLICRRLSLLRSRSGATPMAFDSALQDVRYALRSFRNRPAFTLVAVGTIGLGVGADTAIFSLVDGVLLGAVPGVREARGLVEISRELDGEFFDVSYPVFRQIARETPGLEDLAGFDLEPVSLATTGEPEATLSLSVTAGYFDVLALRPGRGRFFAAGEATPPTIAPVAVVSHHLWRTRLGGSGSVVGSSLRVNGVAVTVVGVGPEGFRGHTLVPADVFLPLGLGAPGLRSPEILGQVESGVVELLGRIAPGASLEAVEASASEAADRLLREEVGAEPGAFRARVEPWGPVPAVGRGAVSAFLLVLVGAVGLVLVVACINVGGMLLARSADRQGEIAVRRALGAGRGRIVRQLLTESLLLFLAGGLAGVLLAVWLTRLLLAFEPPLPPGFDLALDVGVDGRVLAFALGVTVVTALVFSLLPALRATALEPAGGMAAGGRGRTGSGGRIHAWLVAGQVAGSLTLLVLAGLFVRSLTALGTVDPGWETDGVHSVDLDLDLVGAEAGEGRVRYRELLQRLGVLPGVRSAALAARLPLAGRSTFGDVNAAGVEPPPGRTGFEAALNRVTPGYFATLGIDLLEGRAFREGDTEGAEPVAVVNERMAELLWPGRSPVGERFHLGPVGSERGFIVVGVVENTAVTDLSSDPGPFYYLPSDQWYDPRMTAFVRAEGAGAAGLPGAVRETVRQVVPHLPVDRVLPLEERLALYFLPQRMAAWVTGAVGLLGLALAAVGVYGLTAFAVGRRVREFGVRLALGADPAHVARGVVRRGMTAPLVGLAAGSALSILVARAASRFLATVPPTDPAAWTAAVATLLGAALVATGIPALRAGRTDPAESLRVD